jgi:hypothetical protein
VWAREWEFACCGGPFSVGDTVRWRISPAVSDRLAAFLGEEQASSLAGVEDHHNMLPDLASITGRIVEIVAVPDDRARAVQVHSSRDRPPRGGPLAGWLVRLDLDDADQAGTGSGVGS